MGLLDTTDLASRFGRRPDVRRHALADHAAFSDAALIDLIERTPRANYHVNTMPRDASGPQHWREGDMQGVKGHDVLAAVANGNIWVHLKRVHETDGRYRDLLDALFAEMEAQVPGLATYRRSMSILISSPGMNVAYHADVPGQCLWQVRGRKRLWVYPAQAPFLPPEALEKIVLQRAADTLYYHPRFDAHAAVFDLSPGDMALWPRNWPHRVRNADCLNVSFTTEHWTDALRAGYAVDYANGLLRTIVGGFPLSRRTSGLGYGAKFALTAAHKAARKARQRPSPRLVDFRVDPKAAAGFVDVPPFAVAG